LLPLQEGLHETSDSEVVSLLIRAIDPAHASQQLSPAGTARHHTQGD
jgi:hypothetical protein